MKIEVAIPCFNEEPTIGKVVKDFLSVLPEGEVVVYDNNSSDQTARRALEGGAKVSRVRPQGKGCVVQAIFEQTEADIVVIVDGDDTYEAGDVHALIHPIETGEADMTIGTRLHSSPDEFRRFHHYGNRLLTCALNTLFRTRYQDILSGYRAFSRHFVENVPIVSRGFEIETELMIQALERGMAIREIPVGFRSRLEGSQSKLNSFRDGYRILLTMAMLLRDHKPLLTFSMASGFTLLVGAGMWLTGYFLGRDHSGLLIFRNAGVVVLMISLGLFLVGLMLNTINTRVRELMSLLQRRRR